MKSQTGAGMKPCKCIRCGELPIIADFKLGGLEGPWEVWCNNCDEERIPAFSFDSKERAIEEWNQYQEMIEDELPTL